MVTLKAHILPHHDLQPPGCRGSQKSVEDLCALIRRYFKESENKFINHAWQTLIRTLLNNSRTEQPNYDFKQGGDAANLLI